MLESSASHTYIKPSAHNSWVKPGQHRLGMPATDSTLDQLHAAASTISSLGSGSCQRVKAVALVQILQPVPSVAVGAEHIHPLQLGTSTRSSWAHPPLGWRAVQVLRWLWESCQCPQEPPRTCQYAAPGFFGLSLCGPAHKMRLQRVEGSWLLHGETSRTRKGHGEKELWGREHCAIRRQSRVAG